MRIHLAQKPYKCPFRGCNKSFRQAGKLSLHKRSHREKFFVVEKDEKNEGESVVASKEQDEHELIDKQMIAELGRGVQN